MPGWLETLRDLTHAGEHAILVTRTAVEVPVPTDPAGSPPTGGGRLVVSDEVVAGSVGEDLHDAAVRIAQALLLAGSTGLMRHNLHGATLLFEPVPPVRFQAALFGGGAVAQAMVRLLGDLPCRTDWFVDSDADVPASRPGNVALHVAPDLAAAIEAPPPGTLVLVMTRNHDTDYAVVSAALRRPDLPSILMLGSQRKRERFAAQMAADGVPSEVMARLICPVGITTGRRPAEIAIGVAARMLQASAMPVSVSVGAPRDL
jgi:xanthine dehydrogenase accessory factor